MLEQPLSISIFDAKDIFLRGFLGNHLQTSSVFMESFLQDFARRLVSKLESDELLIRALFAMHS